MNACPLARKTRVSTAGKTRQIKEMLMQPGQLPIARSGDSLQPEDSSMKRLNSQPGWPVTFWHSSAQRRHACAERWHSCMEWRTHSSAQTEQAYPQSNTSGWRNSEPCSRSNAVELQKRAQSRLSVKQRRSAFASELAMIALLHSSQTVLQSRQARRHAANFWADSLLGFNWTLSFTGLVAIDYELGFPCEATHWMANR